MFKIFLIALMIALLFTIASIEYRKYKACDRYYDWDYGRCTYGEPFGADERTIKKF